MLNLHNIQSQLNLLIYHLSQSCLTVLRNKRSYVKDSFFHNSMKSAKSNLCAKWMASRSIISAPVRQFTPLIPIWMRGFETWQPVRSGRAGVDI